MSRFDRAWGLARSLAIYHAFGTIAGRQRQMRRLYAGFLRPGDLVFDVGAHVGSRVRTFAALGCRVVAVEPQPDCARVLRTLFGRSPRVTVVEAAVSATPGRVTLSVSERTPTVTTLAPAWQQARARESGFAGVRWNRGIEVETTTLDLLIQRFGAPAFVKIDCEGSEPAILAGLSRPVTALSFEYLPWTPDEARACVARLSALGEYVYNWSPGEASPLSSDRWLTGPELLEALLTPRARRKPGDVYARRT
jgi:FkbM family methyltransferase